MHISLYLAVMLTLSTIIALLSLLLLVLERRPQGLLLAVEQSLELDQLNSGTREWNKAQPAVRHAVSDRQDDAWRRRDGRHRKVILGSPPLRLAIEDDRDRDRAALQGWEASAPAAAASGPTRG